MTASSTFQTSPSIRTAQFGRAFAIQPTAKTPLLIDVGAIFWIDGDVVVVVY